MTHSHGTSTPAMSAETVPSEEFVLVPREPTPEMLNAAPASYSPSFKTIWPLVCGDIYRAMIAAAPILSASHLAKEGGEAGAVEAEVERLSKVYAEATGYYVPFHAGLHSESSNRIRTGVKAVLASLHQPSPALAKGGDAVRSHDVLDEAKINALPLPLIARFAGDKDWLPIHDIGVDAPLCRIDVSGKLEPRRFSEIMELKDGDGVIHNPDDFYLDADTPTEGPASQAEGMGGEVNEAAEREAFEKWWPKHWPNAGSVSDNVWQGWMGRAALTPPETAEAVPVGPFVVMSANYSRPFMLGCYDTLNQAVMAQCGSPEKWHVFSRHPVSDPEAARLREDLERVKQENAALREERHLADNALVDRYRDPKTGSFQFPTDVAAIVRRLDATERERDDAVKALEMARAATASDPAPATDDRERLVEALAPADRAVQSLGALISTRPHSADRDLRDRYFEWMQSVQRAHADIRDALNVARAAFATEASR